ncbi:MAG: acetyl esterase [Bacteroidia bacterium]|jgi:acetyl esterase
MKKKYAIHDDFAKMPAITIAFKPWILFLINWVSKIQCYFVRRSLDVAVEDHHIARADGTRLHVFTMTPSALQEPAPTLIYYHGGAFAITYAGLHITNCQRYAVDAGCKIIFVDYQLAPEHPFPAGFDDCYVTLQWVVDNAATLGVDVSRIAVGGDSAGGAMSAGVAQKARDEMPEALCAQMLVYPVMDNTCSTPSATDFVDVPLFNAHSNRNMWDIYLSCYPDGVAPPYAAPGFGQLHDLPLSYVETAEFDPLRDEGLEHALKLQEAGIEVVLNETKGTVHGYDAMGASPLSQAGMQSRVAFLKKAFA